MRKKENPIKIQLQIPKNVNSHSHLKTPKKEEHIFQVKKIKPIAIKTVDGSEEEEVSFGDKEQFLVLQIKQLRRQNNLLKKRISQLTAERESQRFRTKRSKQKQKEGKLGNLQIIPLSINIFFQQINHLLNTIAKLFQKEFTEHQMKDYYQKYNTQSLEQCSIQTQTLLKKYYVKRKLEAIMDEKQDNKYPLLIDLFTQYYTYKQDSDQKIITIIDNMILKAHQLNQIIIQKTQQKKKQRGTLSTIKQQEDIPIQAFKTPVSSKNFVALNKITAYSPAKQKKINKLTMSPSQKIIQKKQ